MSERRRNTTPGEREINLYFSVVTGTRYGTKPTPVQQLTDPCAGDTRREGNYLQEFPSMAAKVRCLVWCVMLWAR